MFSAAANILGTHIPYWKDGFQSKLPFKYQLPGNICPGRRQPLAQVLESLPPTRETQIKFQAPGFGPAQLKQLWAHVG